MLRLPTLIVRDPRRDKWTINVGGYGEGTWVCHQMFHTGDAYAQPCFGAYDKKARSKPRESPGAAASASPPTSGSAPPGTPATSTAGRIEMGRLLELEFNQVAFQRLVSRIGDCADSCRIRPSFVDRSDGSLDHATRF
jgi:hypothetical protein